MKAKHLSFVILLAGALSVARGDILLHGLINTGDHQARVDSVQVDIGGMRTIPTPGWGGDSATVDTFDLPPLEYLPPYLVAFGEVDAEPVLMFYSPFLPDTWYVYGNTTPVEPRLRFWEESGIAEQPGRPTAPGLLRVSPSVVTGSAFISASLPPSAGDELVVCDASGRPVRTLRLERRADGLAAATWRGDDESGAPVPGGIYFCRAAGGPAAKLLVAR